MSLALLFHYLLLIMFRMLVHPSSGACDLFVNLLFWFDVFWCCGVARLGWCVIRMQAEALVPQSAEFSSQLNKDRPT